MIVVAGKYILLNIKQKGIYTNIFGIQIVAIRGATAVVVHRHAEAADLDAGIRHGLVVDHGLGLGLGQEIAAVAIVAMDVILGDAAVPAPVVAGAIVSLAIAVAVVIVAVTTAVLFLQLQMKARMSVPMSTATRIQVNLEHLHPAHVGQSIVMLTMKLQRQQFLLQQKRKRELWKMYRQNEIQMMMLVQKINEGCCFHMLCPFIHLRWMSCQRFLLLLRVA